MYNEELEHLIKMALMDGVLSTKEKHILFKKAESFGIDLDEFEMVLNGRLFEKQQSVKPQSNTSTVVENRPLSQEKTNEGSGGSSVDSFSQSHSHNSGDLVSDFKTIRDIGNEISNFEPIKNVKSSIKGSVAKAGSKIKEYSPVKSSDGCLFSIIAFPFRLIGKIFSIFK